MIVSLIPTEYVDKEWSHVANLLCKAILHSGGRWDIGSVYEEVKAGRQHLFIVYDEDEEKTKAALDIHVCVSSGGQVPANPVYRWHRL